MTLSVGHLNSYRYKLRSLAIGSFDLSQVFPLKDNYAITKLEKNLNRYAKKLQTKKYIWKTLESLLKTLAFFKKFSLLFVR